MQASIEYPLAIIEELTARVQALEQANQALRQSEGNFRLALQHSPILVFQQDRDLRYTWLYNPHPAFDPAEVIGTTDFDALPAEDAAELTRIKRQAMATGATVREEVRTTINGQAFYYDLVVEPLCASDGTITGIVAAAADVTERHLAQEQIAFQAHLLENVNDAVLGFDNELRITAWNPAAEKQYGWTAEEVLGRAVSEVVGSQVTPEQRGEILRSVDETGCWRGDLTHARRDGTCMAVEATCMPLRDAAGNCTGYVTVNRDITARKEAEAQRAAAQEAAHRHAAQAQALAKTAQRLNARLDLDGVLQAVCEETAQALHVPAVSVALYDEGLREIHHAAGYGLPPGFAESFRPMPRGLYDEIAHHRGPIWVIEDLQAFAPALPNAQLLEALDMRSRAAVSMLRDGELVGTLNVFTLGAARRFSEDELALLQGLANQAALAIANARLFEEVQTRREQLSALSRRLVESLEVERRDIALELHDEAGQLLSSLIVGLGILEKRYRGSTPALNHIALLRETADSAIQVIHRVAVSLRPASLDQLGLLPALRQLVQVYQGTTPLQLDLVTLGFEQTRVQGPAATALYRIVQEALTNVVRHASATTVGIVVKRSDNRVMAIVEDDGAGFDVQAAFECGRLGLLGMRERAEMLGGSLTVESAPGKGTTVFAEIPC